MKYLIPLIIGYLASALDAQMTWTNLPAPFAGAMCFDSLRGRIVMPGNSGVHEFDGASWTAVPTPGTFILQMAFDGARGRSVGTWPGGTAEWDGVNWVVLPVAPATPSFPSFLVYHGGLGRVLALVPTPYTPVRSRIEIYDWDGAVWTRWAGYSPLNVTNPLPGAGDITYFGAVYDARRDKLLVYGTRYLIGGTVYTTASTWEWDALSGWASVNATGPADISYIWFDERRGRVLRAFQNSTSTPLLELDPQQGWVQVSAIINLPPYFNGNCYDGSRGIFYCSSSNTSMAALTDQWPADFAVHGSPCQTPSPPTLGLAAPWTRAWLGEPIELLAANLPLSTGFLAMGFTDQQYSGTPLPLDLAQYGMPGCALRVAPEATALLMGANGSATHQIPIPFRTALVGVPFWQQVLALAPGTNPTGMLTSASWRGTVGRKY